MGNPAIFALAFYVVAIATLVSALMVVVLRSVVRAALALISTFFFVAWIYLLLGADLLWVAQLLIYAGAIPVLVIFAIMLTRRPQSEASNPESRLRPWAAVVGLGLFGLLSVVLLPANWRLADWPNLPGTTVLIGQELVRRYAVPFEVVSILLLAGLVGAVVLAHRQEDA